ncbi:unnamed protein product [Lampetra planeri]
MGVQGSESVQRLRLAGDDRRCSADGVVNETCGPVLLWHREAAWGALLSSGSLRLKRPLQPAKRRDVQLQELCAELTSHAHVAVTRTPPSQPLAPVPTRRDVGEMRRGVGETRRRPDPAMRVALRSPKAGQRSAPCPVSERSSTQLALSRLF